ncbi:hypothetical protein L218DRAFT_311850 [Marasmius fiardii PR-910]|nr:hypothetical protein L218DRAFT_311850 [Marasmius fiardii PR-910]
MRRRRVSKFPRDSYNQDQHQQPTTAPVSTLHLPPPSFPLLDPPPIDTGDGNGAEMDCLRQLVDKAGSGQIVLRQPILGSSAVSRVPTELWYEIFTLACRFSEYRGEYLSISSKEMSALPLRLSHVSSQWRNIITSLPNLWSTLGVDFYVMSKGMKKIIKLYLQNSGSHPLQLRTDSDSAFAFNPESTTLEEHLGRHGHSPLQVLMTASPRCAVAEVNFENKMVALIPKKLRRRLSFPLLHQSSFFCWGYGSQIELEVSWFSLVEAISCTQAKRVKCGQRLLIRCRSSMATLSREIINWSIGLQHHSPFTRSQHTDLLEFRWSGGIGFCDDESLHSVLPVRASSLPLLYLSFINLHELNTFLGRVALPTAKSIEIGPLESESETYQWKGERVFAAMLERFWVST